MKTLLVTWFQTDLYYLHHYTGDPSGELWTGRTLYLYLTILFKEIRSVEYHMTSSESIIAAIYNYIFRSLVMYS